MAKQQPAHLEQLGVQHLAQGHLDTNHKGNWVSNLEPSDSQAAHSAT